MNSINELPPELLVHIFSFYIKFEGYRRFLRNIPRVCKKWKDLHSTPLLWVDINSGSENWSRNQMNILGERGLLSYARRLRLQPMREGSYVLPPFSDIETRKLISYCYNLIEVKLTHCFMSKITLGVLAERCPNIQSLDWTQCFFFPLPTLIFEDLFSSFLKLRGQNLKQLRLSHVSFDKHSVSKIASCCKSLEGLKIWDCDCGIFPVDELAKGCLKLRELEIHDMTLVLSRISDHYGFKNMVSFRASRVDFGETDVYSILNVSEDLEELRILDCKNVILSNISRIPSDKVKVLELTAESGTWDGCSKFLEEAVRKWKRSLLQLELAGMVEEPTKVLEAYLYQNPDPKLQRLSLESTECVERRVLVELMETAKNLSRVNTCCPEVVFCFTREDIEDYAQTTKYFSSEEWNM